MNDEEVTGQHLAFNEGLPTKPDVDLLLKTWPAPKVGDRFEYSVIEELLRLERESTRFHTVTNKWRDRVQELLGFVIECDAGKAFYCASADQVCGLTDGVLRGFGRKARRQRKKLVITIAKAETQEQRLVGEHHARLMVNVEREAKKHRMNGLPGTEIKAQPQISPPIAQEK